MSISNYKGEMSSAKGIWLLLKEGTRVILGKDIKSIKYKPELALGVRPSYEHL